MSQKTIQFSFFMLLSVGLLVFSFFIFRPYLSVVFLSATLAVVFYPLYQKLLAKTNGSRIFAALLTVLVIFVCLIVPIIILSGTLIGEAIDLYNYLALGGTDKIVVEVNNVISSVPLMSNENFSPYLVIDNYTRDIFGWIIGHFDSFLSAFFGGLFNFILMLLALYYFLVDGERIRENIIGWNLLPQNYSEQILSSLGQSIDVVLRGRFLVSIAQGLLVSIGFLIFGIPNPIFWGFVAMVASLVPIVGTSVVTLPAIAYLWLSGHVGLGLGLLLWSAICVGLVDNVLSFFFLKGRLGVHPLIILFAILGGIQIFGPIGFLVGPVAVSAFFSIMKIYPFVLSRDSAEFEI